MVTVPLPAGSLCANCYHFIKPCILNSPRFALCKCLLMLFYCFVKACSRARAGDSVALFLICLLSRSPEVLYEINFRFSV